MSKLFARTPHQETRGMTLIETTLGIFILLSILLSGFSLFNDFRLETAVRRAAREECAVWRGLKEGVTFPAPKSDVIFDWHRDVPTSTEFSGKLFTYSATSKWLESKQQNFLVQSEYATGGLAEFSQKNYKVFTLSPQRTGVLVRTGTFPRITDVDGSGKNITVSERGGSVGKKSLNFSLDISSLTGSGASQEFWLPENLLSDSSVVGPLRDDADRIPASKPDLTREKFEEARVDNWAQLTKSLTTEAAVVDASNGAQYERMQNWVSRVDAQVSAPSLNEAEGTRIPVMIYVKGKKGEAKNVRLAGLSLRLTREVKRKVGNTWETAEESLCESSKRPGNGLGGAMFTPDDSNWNLAPRGISNEYAETSETEKIDELRDYRDCKLVGGRKYKLSLSLGVKEAEPISDLATEAEKLAAAPKLSWRGQVIVYFPQYDVKEYDPSVAERTPISANSSETLCTPVHNAGKCGCSFNNGEKGNKNVSFLWKNDGCHENKLFNGCAADETAADTLALAGPNSPNLSGPDLFRKASVQTLGLSCPTTTKPFSFQTRRICETREEDGCLVDASDSKACSLTGDEVKALGLNESSKPTAVCLHKEVLNAVDPKTTLPCTVNWTPSDCSDSPYSVEQATSLALTSCPSADPKTISLVTDGVTSRREYPSYGGVPIDPAVRYSNDKFSCDLFKVVSEPVENTVGSQPFLGSAVPADPSWATDEIKKTLYGKGIPAESFLQINSQFVGVYGPQESSAPRRTMYSCNTFFNKTSFDEYKNVTPSECRPATLNIFESPGSLIPGPTKDSLIASGVTSGTVPLGCEDGGCYVLPTGLAGPLPSTNDGVDQKKTAELALNVLKASIPDAHLCTKDEALNTPGCVVTEVRYNASDTEAVYAVTYSYSSLFSWNPVQVTSEQREMNAHARF